MHPSSQPLLPGLPDHLAQLCLSLLPSPLLFSVSHSWRRLLYSPSFPSSFLSLYAILSNPKNTISFHCFDPISNSWSLLPPPPPLPPLLIHHPSFLSRSLPIQSTSTSSHLILLAASTLDLSPALPRPLVFHPSSLRWSLGPLLLHPRRWCAAGSDPNSNSVYIASGVGSSYRSDVARSASRWEVLASSRWEAVASLRDGRFSREATNAVAVEGKVCMVNVEGRGAKEGVVYDVERDVWEEMPMGMLKGWTGPVAAEKGEMWVVDEVSGEVRGYGWKEDRWEVVVPAAEERKGAVVAAVGKGKICVAVDGGGKVEVVDLVRPEKNWTVEVPQGRRVVALHVLPCMREQKNTDLHVREGVEE